MTNTSTTVVVGLVLTLAMLSLASGYRPAFVATMMRGKTTMSMPTLPSNVVKYSQVPKDKVFTADKIPKGLLKQHSTKKGTWGIINVQKGALEYKILEPTEQVFELQAPTKGVIEPTVLHQVRALTQDLEFVVEFYRLPGTGPVDEKRE